MQMQMLSFFLQIHLFIFNLLQMFLPKAICYGMSVSSAHLC